MGVMLRVGGKAGLKAARRGSAERCAGTLRQAGKVAATRAACRASARARAGAMRRVASPSGQMTIELAVALPVLIVVAVVAVNAMTFFSDCAVFDRVAHEAVRVHAASPAYGQDVGQTCALVEQTIESQLDASNLSVSVAHGVIDADFDEYTATLEFAPTLFGMGLRSEVFGVSLPRLKHVTRYVVDSYRSGVIA